MFPGVVFYGCVRGVKQDAGITSINFHVNEFRIVTDINVTMFADWRRGEVGLQSLNHFKTRKNEGRPLTPRYVVES